MNFKALKNYVVWCWKTKSLLHKNASLISNKELTEEQYAAPDNFHPTTEEDWIKYNDDRLAELPQWIVEKSVEAIKKKLLQDDLEGLIKEYIEKPGTWWSKYHFWAGMTLRNLLRDNVCLDDKLPKNLPGGWDNYYVPLLEIAIGVREMPEWEMPWE
jgi:hypothetical protein